MQENSRPRNGLSQRLETTQNTSVVRERRQIGSILRDEPIQELLKGLAGELPEENERVRTAETAATQALQHIPTNDRSPLEVATIVQKSNPE